MSKESLYVISNNQSLSLPRDSRDTKASLLSYGSFPLPFVRVSETIKRCKPACEMTNGKTFRNISTSESMSKETKETFTELERRLGTNTEKCHDDNSSEKVSGYFARSTVMDELPHPNQLSSFKNKRKVNRMPAYNSVVDEHLSQLQRKQQLLMKKKPLESVTIRKDFCHSVNAGQQPPVTTAQSVVMETTKQCFLTLQSDTALGWSSSLVTSLSSAGLKSQGEELSLRQHGMVLPNRIPWERLVTTVQRKVVKSQKLNDSEMTISTPPTTKKRRQSDSPVDAFLHLHQNSFKHTSSTDGQLEGGSTAATGHSAEENESDSLDVHEQAFHFISSKIPIVKCDIKYQFKSNSRPTFHESALAMRSWECQRLPRLSSSSSLSVYSSTGPFAAFSEIFTEPNRNLYTLEDHEENLFMVREE